MEEEVPGRRVLLPALRLTNAGEHPDRTSLEVANQEFGPLAVHRFPVG